VTGRLALGATIATLAFACGDPPAAHEPPRELAPLDNPFGPDDPAWAPQPPRDRPSVLAPHPDGTRLFVALTGTESEPRREIAVVDAATLATERRIEVGPAPAGLAIHAEGRFMVVTNRLARYASVVDLDRYRVVDEIDVPYYTEAAAFSPDGRLLVLANRWKDAILRVRVNVVGDRLEMSPMDRPEPLDAPVEHGAGVGHRPVPRGGVEGVVARHRLEEGHGVFDGAGDRADLVE